MYAPTWSDEVLQRYEQQVVGDEVSRFLRNVGTFLQDSTTSYHRRRHFT